MSETDEKLIACCGLHCGDCFAHKGKVADLARDLRKELRDSRFDKVAAGLSKIPFFKEYKDYDKAYAVLGAMVRFRCRRACSGGGGPPSCRMRSCSRKKGYEGCWDCGEFEDCAHQKEFARSFHGDATLKNLRTIRKAGKKEFVKGKRNW
jgi:hypothetical protein